MLRRILLVLLALCFALAAVWAQLPTPKTFKQAPMLDAQVTSGKLPAVKDRLPKDPFVVGPGILMPEDELKWEVGKYGGTERLVRIWPVWEPSVFIQDNEPILYGTGLGEEPIKGNVVKSYEVSADQKVFTFHMREGMKWSDGKPVTTDDVKFAVEDALFNEKITPVFPTWLKSGNVGTGTPMKLDVIDKYTFKISFDSPYGGFPTQLAINGWRGYTDLIKPKHFDSKYHVKYTPLASLEADIKKNGYNAGEWWQLFNKMSISNWAMCEPRALGYPVLTPWMVESSTQTVITYVRNPYYWKVDTAGQQLPYIDRMRSELVATVENVTMKIIGGEVDHSYEFGTLPQLPLYKENQTKGNYNLNFYTMHRTEADVFLNLTYKDENWRKVVRDIRFRQALNKAINYEDIVETVYFGFASVPRTVPSIYDPAGANQLLDEMGMDKKDAQGYRLGPDGQRFEIPIELHKHFDTLPKTAELVAEDWKAVGVYTTVKVEENNLIEQKRLANELKAHVIWTLRDDVWWTIWSTPTYISYAWELWFNTGGKEGEVPPAELQKNYKTMQSMYTVSPKERERVHQEYVRQLYANLWILITAEDIQYLVMTNKNMGNVATKGFGIAAQFAGEQYFFRK